MTSVCRLDSFFPRRSCRRIRANSRKPRTWDEVVDSALVSEGSACGSKDDDEVSEDVDEAGDADRRVRRSEDALSSSAMVSEYY
jgi:hypothetical protein